jgi:hypothetical protein
MIKGAATTAHEHLNTSTHHQINKLINIQQLHDFVKLR